MSAEPLDALRRAIATVEALADDRNVLGPITTRVKARRALSYLRYVETVLEASAPLAKAPRPPATPPEAKEKTS